MRLFIAIDLDDESRRAIGARQKTIAATLDRSGRSSLKWVRPEHMHLTLAFLGEVAEQRVPALTESLTGDIHAAPFQVVFGGVGVFPTHGAPHVLWLGLSAGAADAVNIEREVAGRLARLGFELDQRPFHPHLTLARWRTSRPSDARRAVEADRGGDVARIRVDHVTLYHSRLSPEGPGYTALARATLTPWPS